jgi:hypothetical protein
MTVDSAKSVTGYAGCSRTTPYSPRRTPHRRRGRFGAFTPTPCFGGPWALRKEVELKTLMKRTVMWMYCHGLLSMTTTQWVFDHFDLKGL